MAFVISALIAQIPALESISQRYQNAFVVPLQQGFGLIPITDAFRLEIHAEDHTSVYSAYGVTESLRQVAVNASQSGAIAYIEAEMFGGTGTQTAIVWENAKVIFEQQVSEKILVISPALRILGVQVGAAHDEFDALGLGKYRNTEAWLKDISG